MEESKKNIMEDNEETLDNVYKIPRNLLFIGGPNCTAKAVTLKGLNNAITPDLPFVISPITKIERPKYAYKDSLYSDLLIDIAEYSISFYESCRMAKENPDKIIINTQCSFDWHIKVHTLNDRHYLGDDEHYMLCAIFQTAFEPWEIVNFRVIMIYPDLFTLLEDEEYQPYKDIIHNRDGYIEDLHMRYHTTLINNLAHHMPYFELIESSNPTKRLNDIVTLIQDYKVKYDEYIKEHPEEYLTHPAIDNDNQKAAKLREAFRKHLG